jgi:DNA-binding beta-propeller fold protein YncE
MRGSDWTRRRRRPPGSWLCRSLLVALLALAPVGAANAVARPAFTPAPGSPFATGASPRSVAFDPSGRLLAATNGDDDSVSVFTVAASGALTPAGASPTAQVPVSVAFSPSGRLLATADAGAGAVSVFAVAADGKLTEVRGSPFHIGRISQPSSVAFSPSGHLLATANVGRSTISVFLVDQATGALHAVPGSPFDTGLLTAPVSVAFGPSGALLASANLLAGSVSMFSVDQPSGELRRVPGSPFRTGPAPRSVAFDASGGLLATANNGNNSVSMFSVAAGGKLTRVTHSPFRTGFEPFSVAFSRSPQLLAVANAGSDGVSVSSVIRPSHELVMVPGSPFETSSSPRAVAFSPRGGLIAIANAGADKVSVLTVAPPSVHISSPAPGGSYSLGELAATSFRCTESRYGPGIASCTDSNGRSGTSGRLDTATPGQHAYRVTAVSIDGQIASASISYAVTAPLGPSARIISPPPGGIYEVGEAVSTSFGCTDGAFGPGLASCTDSGGASAPRGRLNTATVGRYTYSVTAASRSGLTASASIGYVVAGLPSVLIERPASGASYALHQRVVVGYSCREGAFGPGIASCAGTAPDGALLNTSSTGRHTFTVTARSQSGQRAAASVRYTVAPAPASPRITRIRATPLTHGCVTETGTHEREITASIADATCRHFRLTLDGVIPRGGAIDLAAAGTVTVRVDARLPFGLTTGTASGRVTHGRWRVSLILAGVNLDPIPPSYLIVARYRRHRAAGPATTRRLRLESERAGL